MHKINKLIIISFIILLIVSFSIILLSNTYKEEQIDKTLFNQENPKPGINIKQIDSKTILNISKEITKKEENITYIYQNYEWYKSTDNGLVMLDNNDKKLLNCALLDSKNPIDRKFLRNCPEGFNK